MPNLKPVWSFLLNRRTILVIYIVLAIIASVQMIAPGKHMFTLVGTERHKNDIALNPAILHIFEGKEYTDYNNYVLFRQSHFHLLSGKDLYTFYPDEQWDLYKYSPTFALLFGALAYLPDMVGLPLWNILNALALFAALWMLPFKNRDKSLLLWFVLLELLTSMQNAQSNGLLAGLMIAAYGCLQRGKAQWATLWLVMAAFIKVYGAIGFCLFLFYPDKIKFIVYSIIWTIIFLVLPLLVTPYHTLIAQYQSWIHILGADEAASYGLSVMGWLHSWFGLNSGKNLVMLLGVLIFLFPLVRWKLYSNDVFRIQMLASMLIWVIIFNHKAESPTFIIAVAGVGIWYFLHPKQNWRTIMLWIVFVGTCLTPSDIFPRWLKTNVFVPYAIKAVPCIIMWCIISIELLTMKKEQLKSVQNS